MIANSGTLKDLWTEAWARMPSEASQKAIHVTFATVGLHGGAEARTVALRNADPSDPMVEIYTDTSTPKIAELAANPVGTVMIWNAKAQLQVRLRAHFAVLTGERAAPAWRKIPAPSKGNYGVTPPPGTPIQAWDDYERTADQSRFAILRGTVQHVDIVHLGEPVHRRASYQRSDNWQGEWLAP